MKKESALRKTFKKLLSKDPDVHLTWVESHSTAIGAPDLQYCCNDVEGWLELKSGPDIEVRATQARWMKDHIESGGRPLFFIEWGGVFHVVPGSRADDLRADPSHESVRKASVVAWRSGARC